MFEVSSITIFMLNALLCCVMGILLLLGIGVIVVIISETIKQIKRGHKNGDK